MSDARVETAPCGCSEEQDYGLSTGGCLYPEAKRMLEALAQELFKLRMEHVAACHALRMAQAVIDQRDAIDECKRDNEAQS